MAEENGKEQVKSTKIPTNTVLQVENLKHDIRSLIGSRLQSILTEGLKNEMGK